MSFEQSLTSIQRIQAEDDAAVDPISRTIFLNHGKATPRAALLLHGYTNSPRQFALLGEQLHAQGWNVLIPRAPFHGLQNRLDDGHGSLTPKILLDYLTRALAAAQGLGEHLTVAGLSMGGVLTGWAAHHHAQVSHAVLISPAVALRAIPGRWARLLTQAIRILPNRFEWWDPERKDERLPPLHAYPRYSTRALAAFLSVAQDLHSKAQKAPPKAGRVTVVINPADDSVDMTVVAELAQRWQAAGGKQVETYTFDPALNLIHDLIDPTQPQQQVDVVYPVLMKCLLG